MTEISAIKLRKTLLTISALFCSIFCVCGQAGSPVTVISREGIKVKFPGMRPYPVDTLTVTIIGDVMLHQAQIDNCHERYAHMNGKADPMNDSHYDFTPYFAGIKDMLQGADLCIANMEFTNAGAPFSGYPAFCAPDSYSEYVADCGVDVFLTANNHIFDKGAEGVRRTLEVYDGMSRRGIANTGCFADSTSLAERYPLIVDCNGLKIGIVNFTYGTNVELETPYPKVCDMDREEVAAAMISARQRADVVIALPHWGIEYELAHSDDQEKMMNFLVRLGADAIIGSHPHVVQDIATIAGFPGKSIPVVYSLGNIISNMSATNTQIGLIVTLPVVRFSDGKCRVDEPQYTLTWCSLPGRLTDSHVTIPIAKYIGRRDQWKNPADYDKMIATYERIKTTSGISE